MAALAIAALLVIGVVIAAFSLRFALTLERPLEPVLVLSEIARAPAPRETPPRRREAPPPEAPRTEATAPDAPAIAPTEVAVGAPVDVTDPVWLSRPANPERFYPRSAFMRGVEGRVALACMVELDGRLSCEIENETPRDQGFGEAALDLAHAHVMRPQTRDGALVRGRYRMVVPFSLD